MHLGAAWQFTLYNRTMGGNVAEPLRARCQQMPEPAARQPFALRLEPDDPAPAYVQLERQVRIAVADGVLRPGDRLLSVRAAAAQLGLATNTVGRAYADLAREGVLVTRPGGGSAIAAFDALDQPALVRKRRERLEVLARQISVRALSLGLDPAEVVQAVARELAQRGHPVDPAAQVVAPVDDEPALLSARNQLRGTIVEIRGGEQIVEVRFRIRDGTEAVAVVTRASLERLGLQVGKPLLAHIKATEITLSR
jgi:GntR family transcriptional regulator